MLNNRDIMPTQSHRDAFETMRAMGELFFTQQSYVAGVQMRLAPLLVGPTGVGKSALIEQVAKHFGAYYLRLTRGDWLVSGARQGRSTVFSVLDAAMLNERTLLHIDELDKFQISFDSQEWSASVASDLWNVLDRRFLVDAYIRETPFKNGDKPTVAEVMKCVREGLWIVGSGTWQSVFDGNRASTVGFQPDHAREVEADQITQARMISPELLFRFNSQLQFLRYPNVDETEELLEKTGIRRLAEEFGERIHAKSINWNQGGMRVLETLATRLAIQKHQREQARLVAVLKRNKARNSVPEVM